MDCGNYTMYMPTNCSGFSRHTEARGCHYITALPVVTVDKPYKRRGGMPTAIWGPIAPARPIYYHSHINQNSPSDLNIGLHHY